MFDLKKAIIPAPKEINDAGKLIKIASFMDAMPEIVTEGDDARIEEAANLVLTKLSSMTALISGEFGEYKIIISVNPDDKKFKDAKKESYYIETKENEALLCGFDEAGAFYAATTFCQMLSSNGDDVYVAKAEIYDYPDFPCRGQFIECRYGTEFMTKDDWFSLVDYMSEMKSNQLTVGVYGCWAVQYDERDMQYLYVPIKKYPELKTPKNIKYYSVDRREWIHEDNILPYMFEEDFFGELIAYGKRKNVTVKPLFNSLGHNTLIPRTFPEICAKNEDGTITRCGFCTNNEKTYEVMFNIYDEIIERYLEPNGITDIEIGLDEVGKTYICHCEKCKDKTHAELMVEYIIKLCKYLKSKGMKRIYIYHDMLFAEFDIVNEDLKKRFIDEGIYDEVVLDWWSYEDPIHLFWNREKDVNGLFHSVVKPDTGYYHWDIPTENNENIRACAKLAKRHNFEGIESYSSFEHCYDKNYLTLADVSWNTDNVDDMEEFDIRYAYRHFRDNIPGALEALKAMHEIMIDETHEIYMNRVCYKFDYYFYGYKKADKDYPQNFPGDAFKLICDDENTYLSYMEFLKQKSSVAKAFFDSNKPSRINKIWRLISSHYYVIADEYISVYRAWKAYKDGIVNEFEIKAILDRLIAQREELMLLAEDTRIKATSYTYLRNMSVFRQYLIDLRDFVEAEIASGRKPEFDITDLRNITGERFKFLQ